MSNPNETPQPSRLRKTSNALGRDARAVEHGAAGLLQEFKAFILRGNVVDLAVAVVIGAAFSGIVTALVKDLITPLIAAIGGKPDFSALSFTWNKSHFLYGDFLNALVSFLIIAAVIFFFVVKPINALLALRRRESEPPPEPATRDCPYCLNTIPQKATRCGFCTSEVTPEA
jgi:large conductance mechanosensitive channel